MILIKYFGGIGCGPRSNQLDFGGNLATWITVRIQEFLKDTYVEGSFLAASCIYVVGNEKSQWRLFFPSASNSLSCHHFH